MLRDSSKSHSISFSILISREFTPSSSTSVSTDLRPVLSSVESTWPTGIPIFIVSIAGSLPVLRCPSSAVGVDQRVWHPAVELHSCTLLSCGLLKPALPHRLDPLDERQVDTGALQDFLGQLTRGFAKQVRSLLLQVTTATNAKVAPAVLQMRSGVRSW